MKFLICFCVVLCYIAAHFCPGTQGCPHCVSSKGSWCIFNKVIMENSISVFLRACLRRMKCGLGVGGNFVC